MTGMVARVAIIMVPVLGCVGARAPEPPQLEVGDRAIIYYCHFAVPEHVKKMNASFYIVYSFTVSGQGWLTSPRPVKDRFVGREAVFDCVSQWRLPFLAAGTKVSVSGYWKHGVGWTEINIAADGFSQDLRRFGDLNPY